MTKSKKKFAKIASVIEANCVYADIIVVFQTEDKIEGGEFDGMRKVATIWITKDQTKIIARSLGCKKISQLYGKNVQLNLVDTQYVFPEVVGINPTTMDVVKLITQPLPKWITKKITGRYVGCMDLQN